MYRGEPTNLGTHKSTPKEVSQEMEKWVSQFQGGEDNPARRNWIIERMRRAVVTSKEVQDEEMETIRTIMSKVNLKHKNPGKELGIVSAGPAIGQPPHRARQANKDRCTQKSYRPKWSPERHSRSRKGHTKLTSNDLSDPQHPYHDTWKKRNPKHEASLGGVRNPQMSVHEPLHNRNDTRPDEIGLGKLSIGSVDSAYFPEQPTNIISSSPPALQTAQPYKGQGKCRLLDCYQARNSHPPADNNSPTKIQADRANMCHPDTYAAR